MTAEVPPPLSGGALVRQGEHRPWRGNDHNLQIAAAKEAGLSADEAEVDSFTQGFAAGVTVEDDYDGAIVARGRTPLSERQLFNALRPALAYLGVTRDATKVRVFDGQFELRIAKNAAESSRPALGGAKEALHVWLAAGLLGLGAYMWLPLFVAPILWGIGLLVGSWQLRRGLASGRAMLAGRLAVALAMIAKEERAVLPPGESDGEHGT